MNEYIRKQLEYEEKEKRIRYICCVFLSLEALFICLRLITIFSDKYYIELKYRIVGPGEVAAFLTVTAIVCSIAVVNVVLSLKYKGFYIFFECIHILLGSLLMSIFIPAVFEDGDFEYDILIYVIIVFIVFFLRFIIYNCAKIKIGKKVNNLETTDTDE